MKIRITEEIPTAIKPKVGKIYEVTRTEERKKMWNNLFHQCTR